MTKDKWDALSDEAKAKRQMLWAAGCGVVVVVAPALFPLSNALGVICATILMCAALMLAFGAGAHVPPSRR